MGDKLKYHLKKAELYGLLAKKYKYENPPLHERFYRKHYYHTKMVDRLYMESHHGGAGYGSGWESSGAQGWPGGSWPGMGSSGSGWPGGAWSGMGSSGSGWPGMSSPGAGWSGAGRSSED